jgi:hypothetical protein
VSGHTVFGDFRREAVSVYRIETQGSVYIIGVHVTRGRKYAIVRGLPGTDREHVVARDSDPRIGEDSLFEVPVESWVGKELEVATMTSSTIKSAARETDSQAIALVGGAAGDGAGSMDEQRRLWARPPSGPSLPEPHRRAPAPPGSLSETPRIQEGLSRGTKAGIDSSAIGSGSSTEAAQRARVAHQLVVGHQHAPMAPAEPEVPYPERHVRYAEYVAAVLRSMVRRDRLFEDVSEQRGLRERLRRALDDSSELLETIRRRDRK